jgi:hypothetical protein
MFRTVSIRGENHYSVVAIEVRYDWLLKNVVERGCVGERQRS